MGKRKLPKRIAGIKIPKELRKNSKPLLKYIATPQFQAMAGAVLTAAMTAAMTALTAKLSDGKSTTVKKTKRRLRFVAEEGKDRAATLAESVGHAMVEAIQAHLPKADPEPGKATAH